MGERETSIIVGAGLGGVSAVGALRQSGYAGRVLLINGESELPYDRPPLSKTVLLGAEDLSNLYLKPESWYRENEVELISGVAVQQIRDDGHEVQLSDGRVLRYQHLLLTTGAESQSSARQNTVGTARRATAGWSGFAPPAQLPEFSLGGAGRPDR